MQGLDVSLVLLGLHFLFAVWVGKGIFFSFGDCCGTNFSRNGLACAFLVGSRH